MSRRAVNSTICARCGQASRLPKKSYCQACLRWHAQQCFHRRHARLVEQKRVTGHLPLCSKCGRNEIYMSEHSMSLYCRTCANAQSAKAHKKARLRRSMEK